MRPATCYAWGKPGDWAALCVDYDIAAQGESLEQVRRELADAVATYLEYVAELPAHEQTAFLNRKAPLLLRWRLASQHRIFTLSRYLKLHNGRNGTARAKFIMTPAL